MNIHTFKTTYMNMRLNFIPYKCMICGRRFAQSNTRDQHLPVHSYFKSLQCGTCDAYFKYRSTLKQHVKAEHGEGAVH